VDATFAIDYSKDVQVNNDIVDNLLAIVVNLTYDASPSLLYKEKQSLIRRRDISLNGDDNDVCQGPSKCYPTEAPLYDVNVNPIPCPLIPPAHCPSLYALFHELLPRLANLSPTIVSPFRKVGDIPLQCLGLQMSLLLCSKL
jgi:hypothetical protein